MSLPPSNCTVLVAEMLRIEANGQHSLIGIFPNFSIKLNPNALSSPPSPENPLTLPSLAFYAVLEGGNGKFTGGIDIFDPSGTPVEPLENIPLELPEGRPGIIGAVVTPIKLASFGDYTVQVRLDEKKFTFTLPIGTYQAE